MSDPKRLKIVILGANGFIGRRLVESIIATLSSASIPPVGAELAPTPAVVENLCLVDRTMDQGAFPTSLPSPTAISLVEADLTKEEVLDGILDLQGCDHITVYHLAAIMSGPSEREFDLGLKINLHCPMRVMDKMKQIGLEQGRPQTYVFTSTDYVNCFNERNRTVPCSEEAFRLSPVSYGVQKACVELLASDYSRRNFLDARVLRLTCVVVKPGVFDVISFPIHGVVSQPLAGRDYKCTLPPNHPFACCYVGTVVSCMSVLGNSVHGEQKIGHNRVIQVPSKSVTLQELWDAVQVVAKERSITLGSLTWSDLAESESTVKEITLNSRVDHSKAVALGLPTDFNEVDIVRDYAKRFVSE